MGVLLRCRAPPCAALDRLLLHLLCFASYAPLARRALSAASPQRLSPSLSFSLLLFLSPCFSFVSRSSQVRSAQPPIGDGDGSDGDYDDRLELRARMAAAAAPPPPLPGWATGDAEIDR